MRIESLGDQVGGQGDSETIGSPDESATPSTDARISKLELESTPATKIPVHISYEIIRLFSEGLYQSPQKAVEELVSNSYDAGADSVHVLLPQAAEEDTEQAPPPMDPLWVIDNGHGMDQAGFGQLWRVAGSNKANVAEDTPRRPIGQFGIGKLAAYVLAWRLTHISMVAGKIRLASMNFRRLEGLHQYDNSSPVDVDLLEITIEQAKDILRDIQTRDPAAWSLMFGDHPAQSWTAAGLTDFKNLYEKLHAGRLGWVLSTGLPLTSNFQVWLNGVRLISSKESRKVVKTYTIGGNDDQVAAGLGFTTTANGVLLPEIEEITGEARVFESKLTDGKSDQYGRSNGFFIRVRGRVINLEDELFGISALNHAAWARFSMEVDADGLRQHLLSSREGVRESIAIDGLRKYLHGVFNVCRRAYEEWKEKQLIGLDVEYLLKDAPSIYVTEPLVDGVRQIVRDNQESYYVAVPEIPAETDAPAWLEEFQNAVGTSPFAAVQFEPTGPFDRAVRYIPDTRVLVINTDHPFIDKLASAGRTRAAATLFGSAEVMIDVLMQDHGFSKASIIEFLGDRDRVLRLAAGEEPSTAAEVLRRLQVSITNETALERAVGLAFRVLGFEYERRGGNVGGTDGVLYARLGRGGEKLDDYKLVYDAKQTNKPAVPADKININSLEDFRIQENADFGFFIATAYAGQDDDQSKLNRLVTNSVENGVRATMLRVEDLRRLVELHYQYGVTLTRLRSLFANAYTTPQVQTWIDELENELRNLEPNVPLIKLLTALEQSKTDAKAEPNVHVARYVDPSLKLFEPSRLIASLSAVETIIGKRWIEVDPNGGVRLHHVAEQIVAEVERNLRNLLGINSLPNTSEQE